MMQVIREKARGIVAWGIILVIAFVFTFWGVSGYFDIGGPSTVAVVDGTKINAMQIDEMYNIWRINMQKQGYDISAMDEMFVKNQIMRTIVEQQALTGTLQKLGFVISDNVLIESIRSNPNYQVDKKFSLERYKAMMASTGFSEKELAFRQKQELMVSQLHAGISATNFVLPDEAKLVIAIRDQKRDFGYSIIPAKNYIKDVSLDEQEIEQYYQTHSTSFMVPEKVKLDYVELSITDLMDKIEISEENIRDYYEQNKQFFAEPDLVNIRHIMVAAEPGSDMAKGGEAEEQINDLYARLRQGADFAMLAKQMSDDELSAEEGGDLGWISRNDDYPAEVYELKEPGEFTKPVQTDWGWHIFQLLDRKGGSVREYTAVKTTISDRFKREAAEKIFSNKGAELANIAYENSGSLVGVSEQLDLPIKTTELFARNGGDGIAAASNVVEAAFSEDVLKSGFNSEVLRISDDSYVVVRLNQYQPQYQQELAEAQPKIKELLLNQKAQERAKEVGLKLEQKLKDGELPNKATAAQKLSWQTQKDIRRDNRKVNKQVLQFVFAMPKPQEQASVAGWQLSDGDFVVIALNKVTAGNTELGEDSALPDMVARQINSVEAQKQIAAVQASLIDQAKIKYKNQE